VARRSLRRETAFSAPGPIVINLNHVVFQVDHDLS